jgi:hypothetical protein
VDLDSHWIVISRDLVLGKAQDTDTVLDVVGVAADTDQ